MALPFARRAAQAADQGVRRGSRQRGVCYTRRVRVRAPRLTRCWTAASPPTRTAARKGARRAVRASGGAFRAAGAVARAERLRCADACAHLHHPHHAQRRHARPRRHAEDLQRAGGGGGSARARRGLRRRQRHSARRRAHSAGLRARRCAAPAGVRSGVGVGARLLVAGQLAEREVRVALRKRLHRRGQQLGHQRAHHGAARAGCGHTGVGRGARVWARDVATRAMRASAFVNP